MGADLVWGPVVGALTSGIVMISTCALAGAEGGGVFGLGVRNRAGHGTTLTRSPDSPQLAVKNRGSAPAMRLSALSGRPVLILGHHIMQPVPEEDVVAGKPAPSVVQQCAPGSLAAVGVFYAREVPADPMYVMPNRFGGEGGYVCNGGNLQLTRVGRGFFRMKLSAPLPASNDYVLFVTPDARGRSSLYADGAGEFTGPISDIHVFDKNGNPSDPYYLYVQLATN